MIHALAALALAAAAPPAPAPRTFILKCETGPAAPGAPPVDPVRVFRLGTGLLQEWRPQERRFGPNLCSAFAGRRAQGSLEGTVSSASTALTLRLDPAQRNATWRVTGASGLKRTSGPCSVQAEKAATPTT